MRVAFLCSAAILLLTTQSARAQGEHCVVKSRRPGTKTVLDQSIDYVFGTNTPLEDTIDSVFGNNDDVTRGMVAFAKPAADPGADSPASPDDDSDEEDECECVPFYLCHPSNKTIIENGVDIIDIRIAATQCEDQLEVCCGKGDQRTPLPKQSAAEWLGCGRRNPAGVGFRILGNVDGEAQFGEFPWMAALLNATDGGEAMFVGGGSLIHPQVVLTAAHTVAGFESNPSSLRVRLGEWDSQSAAELLPHQTLEVQEVIVHEWFNKATLRNDVALLVLRDAAQAADNVGTVCLPDQGAVIDSKHCLTTGWGKDEYGKTGCYQVILKSIELPSVQREACQALMRRTRLGPNFLLHRSFTCAGGEEGRDACKGDGGGPLVCPTPGNTAEGPVYVQTGIVAWGIGCGQRDVPGVYVDVAKFRHWIDEAFGSQGLETSFYHR